MGLSCDFTILTKFFIFILSDFFKDTFFCVLKHLTESSRTFSGVFFYKRGIPLWHESCFVKGDAASAMRLI